MKICCDLQHLRPCARKTSGSPEAFCEAMKDYLHTEQSCCVIQRDVEDADAAESHAALRELQTCKGEYCSNGVAPLSRPIGPVPPA